MKGNEETISSGRIGDEAVMPEETEDVGAPETAGEADAQTETEMPAGEEVSETEMAGTETGEGNDSEDSGKSREGPKKKGFLGKKKDKKDPRDAQIEELADRVRGTMAEFDSYKEWMEKEKSAVYGIGARDIVKRMLPMVGNFERGLTVIPEDTKDSPFAEGMEVIYKQLLKALEEAGMKPIEAVGQKFDPNFHSAVMHIENENLGENIVAQELQKGYMYRDSVMRHNMVRVTN